VVRQVRYSLANANCLDLVLFLNGIPVATAELKTDFTQSIGDAIDQYRFDRLPKAPGQASEPLLRFPSGALVHFAISNREVHMTTRLEGKDTFFLPFNRGDNGGKGNPSNQNGHPTSYLWEEVWERESWLELIGRYVTAEKDKKGQIKKMIFPRFHQLDATRELVGAVLAEGPGKKYLIQHSAGSGKTNSIAWTAHFLADLHDARKRKMFDTVIVVSDRKVIDGQLQEAIFGFERTTGVVATIKGDGGSKSAELADALGGGKKIVVCTIQTFPFALQTVRELAAAKGKTFAVIADEAHSSQTGEAAAKLKQTLSPEELEDLEDGGEISTEDILAAQMKARADEAGITYVAFTATPKAKTLELFGRRPDPGAPPGENNLPQAFHVYSMRQAIEEGFILDVLQNYTPYSLAFRLAHEGKAIESDEVERNAAMKKLMGWVRLHAYNISQKVKIVVEHYRKNVMPLLDGKAKAMVVLASRKEAVRWKVAIDKYIGEQNYGIGTLVAFSGEVNDPEIGPGPFTEKGSAMNPNLKGRDIKEAFDTAEFHILLVANKFQTGFDQPLLCAMYVDRRLAGIQAVQTLSRLNRAYTDGDVVKDTTYVLDFSDSSAEVLKAFSQYYGEALLENVTDPNMIFDLRAKLDGAGRYDDFEVERVVKAELDPRSKQSELVKAIEPIASRLVKQFADAKKQLLGARAAEDSVAEKSAQQAMDALTLFKSDMEVFIRVYAFLSQIFDYQTTAIEKRAIFFRRLVPLLDFGREREGVDLSKVVLTHHKLTSKGKAALSPDQSEGGKLKPLLDTGTGQVHDPEKVRLDEIIQRVNDLFEGDLTEEHRVKFYQTVEAAILASETLARQAQNNSEEQFGNSPDLRPIVTDAVIEAHSSFAEMSRQYLNDPGVQDGLIAALLKPGALWSKLQGRAAR
jgi:type I restriction enzyme, R subunit